MNAQIKLSYQQPEDLEAVALRLGDMVRRIKLKPQKGRWKLAYIHLELLPCSDKNGIMEQAKSTPAEN